MRMVTQVWHGGPLCLRINKDSITTMANWMFTISSNAQRNKAVWEHIFSQKGFSCWFVWRARCDVVFNSIHPSSSFSGLHGPLLLRWAFSRWPQYHHGCHVSSDLVPPLAFLGVLCGPHCQLGEVQRGCLLEGG